MRLIDHACVLTMRASCWGQLYASNVFSFDTGKALYRHECTPLLLDGLIKTVSLAADDAIKAAISLIKVLKAL